jgi:hypothetical protein
MVIKKEKLTEFNKLVKVLTTTTNNEDNGCVFYEFYQGIKLKSEYILYEKWKNKKSLDKHLQRLRQLLGPTKSGEVLSKKLKDCFKEAEDILYKVL